MHESRLALTPLVPDVAAEPRLVRGDDTLAGILARAEGATRARLTGQPQGPITGLKKVDEEMGGFLPVGVSVLHGSPGAGKTALALQIAASCGCPALFVTTEMTPEELVLRLTARVTETFLGRLKSGEFPPSDVVARCRAALETCPALAWVDATQAFASRQYLQNVAESVREDHPHLLIVVDSLHSWADGAGLDLPEYDRLNDAMAALRAMGHALSCSVLVTCERNRMTMKTGGLSAGAGTRKIEYGAELVLDLHRDEDVKPNPKGEVPVSLHFRKNRNGVAGKKVELRFNGALQAFAAGLF